VARDMPDELARDHGLAYVHDHDPGISRVGVPGRHDYRDAEGRAVRDPQIFERIRKLVIPPAWTQVWICADPEGHIQAIGRDARGRKQYLYHPLWRAFRDGSKFERTLAFGGALPKLRSRVARDLRRRGLPREKVLAAVVRLLEVTLIRVGNDEYAKTNKSFGLTTLRKRHVRLSGVGAVFEFRGKSGVSHKTGFHDARLARVLRRCESLPGQRLFQYLDHEGCRHAIGSGDVNAYLRAAMGEDFSAKDIRTWAGTLLAARALALQPGSKSANEAKQTVSTCVKAVAGLLGNTPTVCRACYIHPAVFEGFEAGRLSRRLAWRGRAAELAMIELLGETAGGRALAAG